MICRASGIADGGEMREAGAIAGSAIIDVLEFAACYVYAPSGNDAASARSRRLCTMLKAGDRHYLAMCAARVRGAIGKTGCFTDFFHGTSVLVPVPGSAPTSQASRWVARDLASALLTEGLGAEIWPGLLRASRVRKSSNAPAGARPTVAQHYASLRLAPAAQAADEILLVDDVVTRGRTLLAAASRLRDRFPRANIRAFALLRTLGYATQIRRLLDPCAGEIRLRAGDAQRRP